MIQNVYKQLNQIPNLLQLSYLTILCEGWVNGSIVLHANTYKYMTPNPNGLSQARTLCTNRFTYTCIVFVFQFLLQFRHYKSLFKVFWLNPNQFSKNLDELIIFIAQVSHCYPEILSDYAQQLIDVLNTHNTVLDPAMRMVKHYNETFIKLY